jgi:sterol desaturase/sphingolipid hydroxylase (fatty acid hydroxylase superfamily)
MAVAEAVAPRRRRLHPRGDRWAVNLGLTLINTFIVRLVAPVGLTGIALLVEQRGWGLLPRVTANRLIAGVLAFVALDILVYGQHVLLHVVPVFWRMHRVHHTDEDIDTTTGIRFHPAEILLSLGLKAAAVAALGVPPLAALIFEIVLNAGALFSHANWRMPLALDRVARLLIVTPDMHRIHHSVQGDEQRSNYGFNFSWWDRVFRTYHARPRAGHDAMRIGVEHMPDPRSLVRLLISPLR